MTLPQVDSHWLLPQPVHLLPCLHTAYRASLLPLTNVFKIISIKAEEKAQWLKYCCTSMRTGVQTPSTHMSQAHSAILMLCGEMEGQDRRVP